MLNKKPFIHLWDEEFSPRYHPNSFDKQTHSFAVTGTPGADYFTFTNAVAPSTMLRGSQASSVFFG